MNENNVKIIDLTPQNIVGYGICGYKDVEKHLELRNKIDWLEKYYSKGLRIKAVIADDGSYQGMIEYIPGEYAHRPVNASNYMFIHCLFVGFRKEYKGKGLASSLIQECIKEAKEQNMNGVCIVCRKGSFMAKKDIFLKLGFELVEEAKPDFELLVLKFNNKDNPSFKNMDEHIKKYMDNNLYILRSVQCPYTEKNVNEMIKTAKDKYNLKVELIDLEDYQDVQLSPSPFGVFCIIYRGKVISYSPISNTRFINIMNEVI